jgi:hypothetical protein
MTNLGRIELAGMRWLRYEKDCVLIVMERQPRFCKWARPDLLGLTIGRDLVEVEIKRTVADFRANAGKRHVLDRDRLLKVWPHWYYFLVPAALAPQVRPMLPAWAGLLVHQRSDLNPVVAVRGTRNDAAPRLTLRECVRMVQLQTQTLMGVATSAEHWRQAHLDLQSAG